VNEFISLLIAGIVTGSIYAITATGLVVTFTTTGIFNFAHGAMGMFLAYVYWQLWQGWHLPSLLALVLVLFGCAPFLGALVERAVMRPLYGAATTTSVVVSLGLLLVLVGLAVTIWPQTLGYNVPEFFSGREVTVNGINLSYEQLITIGIALAVVVVLRVLFKRTRTGMTMRAVVDDPELAELTGARSRRISAYAWMIGVMLAALAGILLAPSTMDVTQLTELVIYGYAAAIVGRLRNLPMTFLGAMLLGIVSSMAVGYVPASALSTVVQVLPMSLLILVLLVMPEGRIQIGRVVRMRPPLAPGRNQTLVGSAVLVAAAITASYLVTGANLVTLGDILVLSLLALSLVPLAGYGGQVSLCQWTFAGLGAVVMHWIGGGHSVLGLVCAIGTCAATGAVLALPALRLRGLYLALITLAFAVLMDSTFFVAASVVGQGNSVPVGRPWIFGMHFDSNRSFVIALAILLGACLIGVGALRRSSFGRRLVALNDSPAACQTIGIGPIVSRLAVFALSAGLAGLAGALYGGLATTVTGSQFNVLESVALFVALTLAGANLLLGAVLAGIGLGVAPVIGSHIPQLTDFSYLLFGLGIIGIGRNPNATAAVYEAARNALRRTRSTPKAPVSGRPMEEVQPVG
jgi:branched-chain amino acid transport system permease protein